MSIRQIRVPAEKLRDLVRKAYDLSAPQGMGFLQYRDGSLPDQVLDQIVETHNGWNHGVYMDYVLGRAVKLSIERDDEGYFIHDSGRWFDHSAEQYRELLTVLA